MHLPGNTPPHPDKNEKKEEPLLYLWVRQIRNYISRALLAPLQKKHITPIEKQGSDNMESSTHKETDTTTTKETPLEEPLNYTPLSFPDHALDLFEYRIQRIEHIMRYFSHNTTFFSTVGEGYPYVKETIEIFQQKLTEHLRRLQFLRHQIQQLLGKELSSGQPALKQQTDIMERLFMENARDTSWFHEIRKDPTLFDQDEREIITGIASINMYLDQEKPYLERHTREMAHILYNILKANEKAYRQYNHEMIYLDFQSIARFFSDM